MPGLNPVDCEKNQLGVVNTEMFKALRFAPDTTLVQSAQRHGWTLHGFRSLVRRILFLGIIIKSLFKYGFIIHHIYRLTH